MDFKFSLVLIDDFSPNSTIARPLSRYSSSLITQAQSSQSHQSQSSQSNNPIIQSQPPQFKPIIKKIINDSKDIEPIVASATGPNTYMVCVTDKITSWIAFQV